MKTSRRPKPMKHKSTALTVVIAIAITTAAFLAMTAGREIIISTENYSAERRHEKLADELLDGSQYQGGYYDVHVTSWFNEKNKTGVITAEARECEELLALYVNFKEIGLQKPIDALIPELNKTFQTDTAEMVAAYCREKELDAGADSISRLSGDELWELMEKMRKTMGGQE